MSRETSSRISTTKKSLVGSLILLAAFRRNQLTLDGAPVMYLSTPSSSVANPKG